MRKFGEEIEIKLDAHQNKISNINEILFAINNVNNMDEIKAIKEYYFRIIETNIVGDKLQLREIVEKIKERETILNKKPLVESFNEIKQNNDNLRNINVVRAEKEDNDKINGMRRSVTYIEIKINGTIEVYESLNDDAIEQILSNEVLLNTLSEQEIIEQLKEHAIKRNVTEIDRRSSESLSDEAIRNELNRIQESYVREAFLSEENVVLKERVDLQKYINIEMPGATIRYSLNSNGERLYLVNDRVFKFVGENRELREITRGTEENVLNGNFTHNKNGTGNIDVDIEDFVTLDDYVNAVDYIDNIIESISMNIGITENQIKFLTRFLDLCLQREISLQSQESHEFITDIPGELKELYEKYCGYAKENSKYVNTEIQAIVEKRDELKKEDAKGLDKPYVPRLVPDKLTNMEKAGFISVAIILESSLLIGGVLAILALVKK